MPEDIVDIYDSLRRSTGRKGIRYTDLGERMYRLVIHVCIFNDRNEMLIQKRVPTKKSFPGYWDVSVGGGVAAGETSQAAAQRELKEELGLDHVFDTYPAISLNTEGVFDDFFVIHWNGESGDLVLQEEEVEDVEWVSSDGILKMIDSGEFIPYHQGLIGYLFHLSQNGLCEYSP